MLMPVDVGGRRAIDLKDVEMLDGGLINGVRCYRLLGQRPTQNGTEPIIGAPADRSTTVWIEEETLLVRRIESGLSGVGLSARTVVDLSPGLTRVSEESLSLLPSEAEVN